MDCGQKKSISETNTLCKPKLSGTKQDKIQQKAFSWIEFTLLKEAWNKENENKIAN